MYSYTTAAEIKAALIRARETVETVSRLCESIRPQTTILEKPAPATRSPSVPSCPVEIMGGPNPIVHPGSSQCWLDFPLSVQDLVDPLRGMTDMLQVMVTVFDKVNPDTRLPREL
ncbi:MAG TPA: hypothetical protein VMT60_02195 [Candidatus Bathyarchaeia archaeon]|nr:hypothetical protein [Candidatus Bathyarchaeia archaeon]